jgi:hypothetical protein
MIYFRSISKMYLVSALLLPTTVAQASLTELVPLHVDLLNGTTNDLTCQALAARWYAFELGSEAPGRHFSITMSFDPGTGTVSMFNSVQVAVPIETLYCGYRGRAWETRYQFHLSRLAHEAASADKLELTCRPAGLAVKCS